MTAETSSAMAQPGPARSPLRRHIPARSTSVASTPAASLVHVPVPAPSRCAMTWRSFTL